MDGFPSGQRGQTVNLLATLSVVRIHLHPFRFSTKSVFMAWSFFCEEKCYIFVTSILTLAVVYDKM